MYTTHHLRLVVNKENYPKCISYTLHLPSAKAGWILLRKQGDEGKACIKSLPLITFRKIGRLPILDRSQCVLYNAIVNFMKSIG